MRHVHGLREHDRHAACGKRLRQVWRARLTRSASASVNTTPTQTYTGMRAYVSVCQSTQRSTRSPALASRLARGISEIGAESRFAHAYTHLCVFAGVCACVHTRTYLHRHADLARHTVALARRMRLCILAVASPCHEIVHLCHSRTCGTCALLVKLARGAIGAARPATLLHAARQCDLGHRQVGAWTRAAL